MKIYSRLVKYDNIEELSFNQLICKVNDILPIINKYDTLSDQSKMSLFSFCIDPWNIPKEMGCVYCYKGMHFETINKSYNNIILLRKNYDYKKLLDIEIR